MARLAASRTERFQMAEHFLYPGSGPGGRHTGEPPPLSDLFLFFSRGSEEHFGKEEIRNGPLMKNRIPRGPPAVEAFC